MVNQLDRSVTCMRALLHSLSSTFVKDNQLWRYLSSHHCCFTDPYCHKPTQSNVTQNHTDTQQPKLKSHRPTLTHTNPNNVTPIENNLSRSIRKCQANCGRKIDLGNLKWLKLPKNATYPFKYHMWSVLDTQKLGSKAPTTNRMLLNAVWVPRSGRWQQALGVTRTKIVYFHRYLWHFFWWESLDIVELKG